MKKTILFFLYLIFCYSLTSYCENTRDLKNGIQLLKDKYNSRLNESYINLILEEKLDSTIVEGLVSDSLIYNQLIEYIKEKTPTTTYENVKVFPSGKKNGIINVSVADLHTGPGFTKSLATQELLGTIVTICFQQDGWSLVQCPNKYFGWISNRQLVVLSDEQLEEWNKADKIVYTSQYGSSYETPKIENRKIVSDLVENNILIIESEEKPFYKVKYPDNRIGYIQQENAKLIKLIDTNEININAVMISACQSRGLPYIWGGLSTKGVDCSGLISSAFRSNGYFTYRDASQQALVGENIEITPDYSNLEYGDLMFFGKDINNIRHVGFYMGDKKFLHASGFVRVSSLDEQDEDYDELNTKEFVVAKRYIDNKKISSAISRIKY